MHRGRGCAWVGDETCIESGLVAAVSRIKTVIWTLTAAVEIKTCRTVLYCLLTSYQVCSATLPLISSCLYYKLLARGKPRKQIIVSTAFLVCQK